MPATVTWVNPSGGDWDTPGNWNTGAVPGPNDAVVINVPGAVVTHSIGTDSVYSLTSADPIVIYGGSLTLAASSTVDALQLNGGTLVANADLTVTGPDGFAPPGDITPYSPPGLLSSYAALFTSGTLGGAGTVYLDGPGLVKDSQATVRFDVPVVNNGYLTMATNGTAVDATLTNAPGATLQFELNTLIDGTGSLVNQAGGTLVEAATPALSNPTNAIAVPVTNAGTVEVDGGVLHLDGGLANSGQVTVQAGGLAAGSANSNSGSILGDPGTVISLRGTLATTATSTIRGYDLSLGTATLRGVYAASHGTTVSGAVTFANCAADLVGNRLAIDGGSFDLTGATLVDAGGSPLGGPLALSDLYLNGNLLINGDVAVSGPDGFAPPGDITPYNPPGLLSSYSALFTSGTLGGAGTVYLDSPGLVKDSYATVAFDVPVVNNSYLTLTTNGTAVDATLTNAPGATLQFDLNTVIDGTGILVNQAGGTVVKVHTPAYSNSGAPIAVPVANAGTIEVDDGTLSLNGGGINTGSIVGAAGTKLVVRGTALTLTPTSSITADSLDLRPGALNIQATRLSSTGGFPTITANSVAIGGQLNLSVPNNFTACPRDIVTLVNNLDSNPIGGQFNGLAEGATVSDQLGDVFQISYVGGTGNDVALSAIHTVNPALTVSVNGPVVAVRGQPLTFTLTPTGDDGPITFNIDWDGNGTVDQTVTGASGMTVQHVYTDAGTDTVKVTATDPDGCTSPPATTTVDVGIARLEDDPLAPVQKALDVGGTTGNDTIVLSPAAGGQVQVQINGSTVGTFAPTSRLVVYAQAGNDDVQVAGGINLPAWLYGDAGDDRLKGGSGTNVLIGGDGNDLLVGGNNRDVLIGGAGADRLVGNAEDDVLVAGYTVYDGNEAALAAVLSAWTDPSRSYQDRVSALTTTGVGTNQAIKLTATTVSDDGAQDVLTGSSGQDWFLANVSGGGVLDKLTDLSAAEFATDLSFILGT